MFLWEQQQEERWKKTDAYTDSPQNWVRDVTYHSLDKKKTDDAWSKSDF